MQLAECYSPSSDILAKLSSDCLFLSLLSFKYSFVFTNEQYLKATKLRVL